METVSVLYLLIPTHTSFKSYYVVWKLFRRYCRIGWLKSLNRTMQYGNVTRIRIVNFGILCLNRTMQYGNTKEKNNQKIKKDMFKSYYVVWKLSSKSNYFLIAYMFKSYYVVWKHERTEIIGFDGNSLNRTMQYGNLIDQKQRLKSHISLNRTMQYGNNFKKIKSVKVQSPFKSYYVVWKLRGFRIFRCVNREFKSYYVVWKLQTFRLAPTTH